MFKKKTDFILNAWYPPVVTLDNFKIYKDCGFDYIFLLGENLDGVNGKKIEEALTILDELNIKAFIDITKELNIISELAEKFTRHKSFVGFNYDEPVIYKNTLTHADGIVDIAPIAKKMHEQYPNVEFLVNLNPLTSTDYPWGTPKFTYEEYLNTQEKEINTIFKGSNNNNWLSCDDYPILIKEDMTHKYLKETWLLNLEYFANQKKNSSMDLKTNFFIMAMPYGIKENWHDRFITYEDLRLQTYTLMAYGYDMLSYFCYATPTCEEFFPHQYSMISRDNLKTETYFNAKKINDEVNSIKNIYSAFKTDWIGTLPIYGKNKEYSLFDNLKTPLKIEDISELKNVESTENIIIGYMKDEHNNKLLVAVNLNDTSYNIKPIVNLEFKDVNKIDLYKNGIKDNTPSSTNKLNIELLPGEGVLIVLNK